MKCISLQTKKEFKTTIMNAPVVKNPHPKCNWKAIISNIHLTAIKCFNRIAQEHW